MRDFTTRVFCGGALSALVISGLLATGSRLDTPTILVFCALCSAVANLALYKAAS